MFEIWQKSNWHLSLSRMVPSGSQQTCSYPVGKCNCEFQLVWDLQHMFTPTTGVICGKCHGSPSHPPPPLAWLVVLWQTFCGCKYFCSSCPLKCMKIILWGFVLRAVNFLSLQLTTEFMCSLFIVPTCLKGRVEASPWPLLGACFWTHEHGIVPQSRHMGHLIAALQIHNEKSRQRCLNYKHIYICIHTSIHNSLGGSLIELSENYLSVVMHRIVSLNALRERCCCLQGRGWPT